MLEFDPLVFEYVQTTGGNQNVQVRMKVQATTECVRYHEDQWQGIETALRALSFKDFLLLASMGSGSDEDTKRIEELGNIPELKGWLNTFD